MIPVSQWFLIHSISGYFLLHTGQMATSEANWGQHSPKSLPLFQLKQFAVATIYDITSQGARQACTIWPTNILPFKKDTIQWVYNKRIPLLLTVLKIDGNLRSLHQFWMMARIDPHCAEPTFLSSYKLIRWDDRNITLKRNVTNSNLCNNCTLF